MAEPRWTPTHVQVTVLQARDLHPKGSHGAGDTYSVLQLGREKYRTSVVERSRCPVWREEAAFPLPGLLEPQSPEQWRLLLTAMQRSLLGPDRFLGEVAINLHGLCDRRERRTGWYRLASRPGKRQKPRGELQVSLQFVRNHLTASMFDLSMKERSRSPFSRLKDKMKGRRPDGSDTASAIVPGSVSDRISACPQLHTKAKKPFLLGPQRLSSAQSMSDLYGPPASSGPPANVAANSISSAEGNGNLPSLHGRSLSTDHPTDEPLKSRDPEVGGSGGIQNPPLPSVSLPQKFATLPRQWAPGNEHMEPPERSAAPETLSSTANGKKSGKKKEKVSLFQRVTGKRPERPGQDGASHEATNPFWEGTRALEPRISSGTTSQIEQMSEGIKMFPPTHGPPNPFEGPGPYTHLTRSEVEQELVKHKELLKKKDSHIRELEDYIDNLLVRVMEETPSILRVPYVPSRKLGKFPQS